MRPPSASWNPVHECHLPIAVTRNAELSICKLQGLDGAQRTIQNSRRGLVSDLGTRQIILVAYRVTLLHPFVRRARHNSKIGTAASSERQARFSKAAKPLQAATGHVACIKPYPSRKTWKALSGRNTSKLQIQNAAFSGSQRRPHYHSVLRPSSQNLSCWSSCFSLRSCSYRCSRRNSK